MMDIRDLLERARSKSGLKSQAAMARAIGLTREAFRRIESERGLPSDTTMLRLCALAEVSDQEGLLILNILRSKGQARRAYSDLLKKLSPAPSLTLETSARADAA